MRKVVLSTLVLAIALGTVPAGYAQPAAETTVQERADAGDGFAAYELAASLLKPDATEEQLKTGLAYLEAADEAGVPDAMVRLGDIVRDGSFGVEADGTRAAALYQRAMELGHAGATMRLAELYRNGAAGLERDPSLAVPLLETAIETDNTTAMRTLAGLLLDGTLPEDETRARALLQRAMEAGDDGATINLARELAKGRFDDGGPVDALELMQPLAAAGNAGAKRLVADLLRAGGEGLDKAPAEALAGYLELAAGGDVWAARAAAEMMIRGETGTADFDGGIAVMVPFGEAGDASVLSAIGNYYAQAEFGNQSARIAAEYYERAIEGGDAGAVMRLAELYRNGGPDLEKDPTRAVALLETGAASGNTTAMRTLAGLLLDGSLPEDAEKARALFQQATDAGDEGAAISFARELAKGRFEGAGPLDALELMQPLAASNAGAKRLVADLLRAGGEGLDKAPAEALAAYLDLAAGGDVWAARAAADMMIRGETGTADFDGGIAVIAPFGEAGDAGVLAAIGNYYAQAEFGQQSALTAASYYERAVAGGDAGAVMRLAELYRNGGPDLEPDPARAAAQLETAIADGNVAAMRTLAGMLIDGALPADEEKARALFQRAIDAGDEGAAISFARELAKGRFEGTGPRDALELMQPLAAAGNAGAKRLVADLLRAGGDGLAKDPAAALQQYLDVAGNGDVWAARAAADMMIRGEAAAADFDGGIALIAPFGEAGDASVLAAIGNYYAQAEFGRQSALTAAGYFERAVAGGDAGAVMRLAELYRNGGPDLEPDPASAAAQLEVAVANGNIAAIRTLAGMLLDGSLPIDTARAAALYEAAIAAGDASATINFANMLIRGDQLAPDPARAISLLTPMAEADNAWAMLTLADLYRRGADGVAVDPERAFGLIEKAAALNDSGALKRKAEMLARGEGTARNVEAAVALLEPFSAAGDIGATLQLGDLFARAEFGSIDAERAIAYYQAAADAGNLPALGRLGDFYRSGLGAVSADPERAIGFYRQAVDAGDAGATRRLADLLLQGDEAAQQQAIGMLESLAGDGDASATIALADLYRDGAAGLLADGARARTLLSTLAATGDVTAKRRLADMLARGQGGAADVDAAIAQIRDVAEAGDAGALLQLGDLLSRPEYGKNDGAGAIAAYASSAERGNSGAFVRLADLYRSGTAGVPRDPEIAAGYLEQAIAFGNDGARMRLGRMLLDGSLPGDAARGAELLRTAADNGDTGAAIALAGFLARGEGVAADGPGALELLEPRASEGNIGAINALADLYRTGTAAIARDPARATALYEQAVAQGDPGAARRLGEMLVRGDAGPADFDRGVTLVSVAADGGDVGALLLLGDFHSRPEYGHVDPALAASFYERASEAGNAAGLTRLGDLYRRGTDGLDADGATAASFYEQSAARGDNSARRNLAAMLLDGSAGTDEARAVALYEEAIAAGDTASAMAMLNYHADGKHNPPDYESAKRYFETALGLGEARARVVWGNLLANGPLAERHQAEGIAVLRDAVANGTPNALITLSRLQMSGAVPGATAETALEALAAAADSGDASAVPMLVQTLRDGFSDKVKRSPSQARTMFDRYESLLSDDVRDLNKVLLDAIEATSPAQYAAMATGFDALPLSSQSNVLGTLRWRQQNAYVYLMQMVLSDHGYYTGRLSGLLTSATISAFSRACLSVLDRASCERGPLSGEAGPVLGLLMAQPKPGEEDAETSPAA